MKKALTIGLTVLVSIGCGAATQSSSSENSNSAVVMSSNNTSIRSTNDAGIISSHSTEPLKSDASSNKPASTSTESPMARPIDVAQMTADIEKAESAFKKNPGAKADLAKAYFVRATALTGAAQYRAALGDYRKGLKLDPNDEAAKKMHDQILAIFQQIGREPPREGEEPAPLPFKSDQPENQTGSPTGDERITFKPNAVTATASGNLNGYDDSKFFVINVKAGQNLRTEQTKSNDSAHYISVEITDPSGKAVGDADASCNNRREISPTVAGDYRIKVFECRKADAWKGKFDLSVSVK